VHGVTSTPASLQEISEKLLNISTILDILKKVKILPLQMNQKLNNATATIFHRF